MDVKLTPADVATETPVFDDHGELEANYDSLECRLGWDWLFGGNRHFAYYDDPGTWWPFPLARGQQRMQAKLLEALALPPGSRVLDAGCGDGHVAIDMARRGGLRVTAFDVLERHVRNAQRNVARAAGLLSDGQGQGQGQVTVLRLDFGHLETVAGASYDGVYTSEALLHAAEAPAVLAEFARVLRPGGRVVLHEFHHDFMRGALVGFPAEVAHVDGGSGPAFGRAKAYFESAMARAGFVDVVVRNYSPNVAPMARLFSVFALWRHVVVLLRLQRLFPNTAASTEGYVGMEHWAYLSVSGTKPGRPE